MKLFKSLMVLAFLITCLPVSAEKIVLSVRTQEDFDALTRKVPELLQRPGVDLHVEISKGRYLYSENHIGIYSQDCASSSLTITGEACTLVPKGRDIATASGTPFSPKLAYVTNDDRNYEAWSEPQQASSSVSVVSLSSGLCRLRAPKVEARAEKDCARTYIRLTEAYRSGVYKVQKISGGYIYFIADDLEKISAVGYNVNADLIYGAKRPRFSLLNGRSAVPPRGSSVHECEASRFLLIGNSPFRSLEVSGVSFAGSGPQGAVIELYKMNAGKALIHGCSFTALKSRGISISESHHVTIRGNHFSDLYSDGIVMDNLASEVTVEENLFERCGLGMMNSFCVYCRGDGYRIKGNVFRDFGYCGIALGGWYREKMEQPSRGVVEGNELFYTAGYLAEKEKHTLMDSGAIYLYTQNDAVEICRNKVHDIDGMKDNRGIFCDDGAYNFNIHDNEVYGIRNSWCIDSRRVLPKDLPDNIKRTNFNNHIDHNKVDGRIRFEQ